VNEENLIIKHTPDAGSIARPGDLKPSALPTELQRFWTDEGILGQGATWVNGEFCYETDP
jgi:hypothetical protein